MKTKLTHGLLAVLLSCLTPLAMAQQISTNPGPQRSPSPEGASVAFANLEDGDEVPWSFPVKFRVTGMSLRPAGSDKENSGHHHLLIDVDELPPMDQPLPNNESVYHFDKRERNAVITLPPGEHTLQLLFADYNHVPHDPPVISERITVVVPE